MNKFDHNKDAVGGGGVDQNIFVNNYAGLSKLGIRVVHITSAPNPSNESELTFRSVERYELCLPNAEMAQPHMFATGLQLAYWALSEKDVHTLNAQLSTIKAHLLNRGVCYLHCPNAQVLACAHICADNVLGADNFIATLVDASQTQTPS